MNTSVKLRWRVKKYSETKSALFTAKILSDQGQPDLQGMIQKITTSLKTGEPTADEVETAAALKQVRDTKPTNAFLEKEKQGDSGSDDDGAKPKAGRRSRAKPGDSLQSSIARNAGSGLSKAPGDGPEAATPPAAKKAGGGSDGDLESQVQAIVTAAVAAKGALLEEKLKYWHSEVDRVIEEKFKTQNQSLLEQVMQLQKDMDTQHHNHIIEI